MSGQPDEQGAPHPEQGAPDPVIVETSEAVRLVLESCGVPYEPGAPIFISALKRQFGPPDDQNTVSLEHAWVYWAFPDGRGIQVEFPPSTGLVNKIYYWR